MPVSEGTVCNTYEMKRKNLVNSFEVPKIIGEPYTGNLYVRFDEGDGINPPSLLEHLCVENYSITLV